MRVLAALALCATLCSAAAAQEEYFPLQEGHSWTYTGTFNGRDLKIVQKVTKKEKVGDVECFVLMTTPSSNKEGEHVVVTKTGVWRHRYRGEDLVPPVEFLRFPVKAGHKWDTKYTSKLGGGETEVKGSFEVVAEEDLEVPAGRFKAFKVAVDMKIGDQSSKSAIWFAKDVGIVQQSFTLPAGEVVVKLAKFEKGKP
ncbi:MAG: hypothetical protein HYY17_09315 [Planctomycetes bacterium]|nr:hypothetical protein [Planctomycetota bacterium]